MLPSVKRALFIMESFKNLVVVPVDHQFLIILARGTTSKILSSSFMKVQAF
jgi:hypothetical protein